MGLRTPRPSDAAGSWPALPIAACNRCFPGSVHISAFPHIYSVLKTTCPAPHNTYIGRLDQVRDSDERLTVLGSYILLKRE